MQEEAGGVGKNLTLDSALTMIAGTARSMGLRVTGTKPTNA
jgi:large subunit ribosomal protein L11